MNKRRKVQNCNSNEYRNINKEVEKECREDKNINADTFRI